MSIHGDHDMGHTVAGWTGTALAFTGSLVAGVAFAAGSPVGLAVGTGVVVLAAVTTWLLHLAGWGKPGGPRPADQWDWRVRDTAARRGHRDCLGCRLAGRRPAARPEPAAPPAATAQPVLVAAGRDRA
ncbi:HGxxPAAW family protein [Kitasatospora sp. NPDC054939]